MPFQSRLLHSSVSKHLHAFGLSAGQGEAGGCKIDSVGGDRVGGMDIVSPVLVPQEACECILNNIAGYNSFIDQNDYYQANPRQGDDCGTKPGCNSNFASGCQLSKCNISHKPSVWAPGFDHKMTKCTSSKFISTGGAAGPSTSRCGYCKCDKWEDIDSGVCGDRSASGTR